MFPSQEAFKVSHLAPQRPILYHLSLTGIPFDATKTSGLFGKRRKSSRKSSQLTAKRTDFRLDGSRRTGGGFDFRERFDLLDLWEEVPYAAA